MFSIRHSLSPPSSIRLLSFFPFQMLCTCSLQPIDCGAVSSQVILRYAHIIIFATISSFRHLLPPPSSLSLSSLLLKPTLFFEPNYFRKQNIARTKNQSQKSVRHAIKFSIKMSVDCVACINAQANDLISQQNQQ